MPQRPLPYLALLVGTIGIAFSGILVKWANVPGAVSGFYRMALAGVFFALPSLRAAQRHAPLSRRHLALAALAGLFFAGDLGLWNTAVLVGTASSATLLGNAAPLWVGLISMLVFKERLGALFWFGLAIAMAGIGVVISQDFLTHPAIGAGDGLALAASVFYALFFIAAQRARVGLSPMLAWWVSSVVTALCLLVAALVLGQPLVGYSAETYALLIALAVLPQIIGYLAIQYALGHLPAALVAPTLLGQPVLTALLAVPLLGEQIGWPHVLGGLLVLGGILLVHRGAP